MSSDADKQAAEDRPNRLPPVSVLPAPGDEDWDPRVEEMGMPITGEAMDAKNITKWFLSTNPYQPPEVRGLYINGECDGKPIKTSRVVAKVAPMTYRTKSSSLYRLDGPPEPGYAQYCAEKKIELDLADPIKLRKSLADFQWSGR